MEIKVTQNIQNKFSSYLVKGNGTTQVINELTNKLTLSKGEKRTQEAQLLKFLEGSEEIYEEKKRQKRSSKLRDEAIKQQGYNCYICSFNFEDHYGDYGKGYIEVHHLELLSKIKGEKSISVDDVKVVCSNCHSVLHRKGKEDPMPVENLKKIVEEKKFGKKTY